MAIKTQGTKYYVKNGTTFVEIGGIQGFTTSGGEGEKIDSTALGDTSPSSVKGMETAVSISAEVNYDPADSGHVVLDALKANGASVNYKAIYNFSGTGNTKFWTGEILTWPDLASTDRNSLLKKTLTLTVNNVRSSE